MAKHIWLVVTAKGEELAFQNKPERVWKEDWVSHTKSFMGDAYYLNLPKGTIKNWIGKTLTINDKPYKYFSNKK
jgi:hypothetical protein